jgi:hypothetical protein
MVAVIETSWQDILDGKPLPESPARQLFTNTVISVAAQAKAALPEANGRVDRARDLVLGGMVSRNADHTFTVHSQSEHGKSYVVSEGVCSCPHAQKGEPTCKHLISTWLWRKASKMLEQQLASDATAQQPAPAQPQGETVLALPEAPASVNFHTTLAGRQVQITLRDTDETRLLARLETLLQRFPVIEEPKEHVQKEGWCYKHNVQMKLNHGKRGSWWSHKLPNGQWCNQK